MIRFEGVTKEFSSKGAPALDSLTLDVHTGETLCLLGTSGSGKTTALKLVNRLLAPTRGRVLVGGEDVTAADPIRLRRRIGYVVQSGALFPHLTAAGNVGLLCAIEGRDASATARRVDELLALVRLPPERFRGRYPCELSGGERQRVGVARALALDPGVVLMDEPFGAVDPIVRAELQDEFLELRDRVSKTILLVTHDVHEAFRLGHRVALLHEGRLVQVGPPHELQERPRSSFVTEFIRRARGTS